MPEQVLNADILPKPNPDSVAFNLVRLGIVITRPPTLRAPWKTHEMRRMRHPFFGARWVEVDVDTELTLEEKTRLRDKALFSLWMVLAKEGATDKADQLLGRKPDPTA